MTFELPCSRSGCASCGAGLYICFNPSFSSTLTLSGNLRSCLQGCWAMVHREDVAGAEHLNIGGKASSSNDFAVKFFGDATSSSWLRPMSDNPETQTLEAAWVMTELIKWQWRHGLRALPDSGATFSMFLSHKCGEPHKIEWMSMPRYFERSVTTKDLHATLQTMFKLLDMFRLPPESRASLLVDTT